MKVGDLVRWSSANTIARFMNAPTVRVSGIVAGFKHSPGIEKSVAVLCLSGSVTWFTKKELEVVNEYKE